MTRELESTDGIDVRFVRVTKRFGDFTAVDAVDLDVRSGEFLALLGPSGCGKTTCLRMIAGFEEATEGEILIAGRPAAGVPPYRRNVNTVFQQYALFPHLSVEDNVAFGLKQRKVARVERRRRAQEALELVRLADMGQRRPAQLSGGQQQRVALARALVMQPRVLLLDEPLGALDLKLRKEMQIELKRIHEEVGLTFVFVTHDQEEAMAMADRIGVMNLGRIEQLDEPRAIYDRPQTAFVANFVGEMNAVRGTLVAGANGGFELDAGAGVTITGVTRVEDAAPGRTARVGIRPERIRAVVDGHDGEPASIVAKMYIGHQLQLVARLRNGAELVVREQRVSADPGLERVDAGDVVRLVWASDAPMLLGEAVGDRSATLRAEGTAPDELRRELSEPIRGGA